MKTTNYDPSPDTMEHMHTLQTLVDAYNHAHTRRAGARNMLETAQNNHKAAFETFKAATDGASRFRHGEYDEMPEYIAVLDTDALVKDACEIEHVADIECKAYAYAVRTATYNYIIAACRDNAARLDGKKAYFKRLKTVYDEIAAPIEGLYIYGKTPVYSIDGAEIHFCYKRPTPDGYLMTADISDDMYNARYNDIELSSRESGQTIDVLNSYEYVNRYDADKVAELQKHGHAWGVVPTIEEIETALAVYNETIESVKTAKAAYRDAISAAHKTLDALGRFAYDEIKKASEL